MTAKRLIGSVMICFLILTGCSAKTENPDGAAFILQNPAPEPLEITASEEIPPESTASNAAAGASESANSSSPDGNAPSEVLTLSEDSEFTNEEACISAPTLTISMVGDILLHTPVEESCRMADGTYDYSSIFVHTNDLISDKDLALVNQEVIIGGKELGVSGYPAFNASYEIGDALVNAGFDVICHATNHALDKGKKGLINCMNYWESTYPEIAVLGVHDSFEDQNELFFYEKDGIRIAILNYTYGTNGIALPEDMPFCVDLLEKEKVLSAIQKAEAEADFTVVCPHWGTEYRLSPDDSQKKWAKLFLENGVDLVLGTHPHVIEPVEWMVDEATGHEMLVYYSLGNFVNWTSSSGDGIANRMVGGMANVTLTLSENDNVVISNYSVTPLICHLKEGTGGVTTYALSDYTPELGLENAIRSQDSAFSYDYCVDLCTKVWGDLWK